MSRIMGIEAKVQIQKDSTRILRNESIENNRSIQEDSSGFSKDEAEKLQINELVQKLPKLGTIFEVHRKIGEGTFSSVYLGSLRAHSGLRDADKRWYAIKHLVPTAHPARIEHELRCLQDIGGKHNVIGVDLCLRHLDTVVFVMPYIPHTKFSEYVGEMDACELRDYMRALMEALQHVHSFGVIHRDVKPSNFLYDRQNKRYLLVDFGLAQRVCPAPLPASAPAPAPASPPADDEDDAPPPAELEGPCSCWGRGGVCARCLRRAVPRAARAGTQGFRPPEVLLKYPHQTVAVDAWAAGVVLASVLCARYPLLRAAGDAHALAELAELVGSRALQRTARALGRRLVASAARPPLCLRKLSARLRGARPPPGPPCARCGAGCLCRDEAAPAAHVDPARSVAGFPDAAFALAARLLEPDPRRRISAAQALEHPFLRRGPPAPAPAPP